MENLFNIVIFYILSGILGLIIILLPPKTYTPEKEDLDHCRYTYKYILIWLIWTCMLIALTLLFTYIFNKYIK